MPESFTPKLVTAWREGYGLAELRADAVAGLTVAIVALPLSMAIAVASGVTPDRGLYTAIIGGLFVSLLGGSRFQVGGPAGLLFGQHGPLLGRDDLHRARRTILIAQRPREPAFRPCRSALSAARAASAPRP